MKKKIFSLLALLMVATTGAWAQDGTTVFELDGTTASVGTLTLGTTGVEASTVKIHGNKDGIPGIKMSNSYKYADGKYFTIALETGSFKKGDKVSIAVCFNNADDTKQAKAAIYADDHETLLYTTDQGINGRTNTTDEPVVEEYVLTQDTECLIIGRNGNTATFVTTLKVVRPASDDIALTTTDGRAWALAPMSDCDVELEVEYETALALNEETDNAATLAEWDGYEADVTLTRTLAAGSWNTFAVPFNIDGTMFAALKMKGVTVKELTSALFDGGTLTLNFADATSIVAGKPYLVKVTANFDLSTSAFPGAIVSKTTVPTETAAVDFIPTLGKTEIAGDTKEILFLASGNTLKHPESQSANMKGFRAYFQLKGEAATAREFLLNLGDGETTGIVSMHNAQSTMHNDVYDLQGRKVGASQKGVYIVNGKKVIK